MSKDRKRTPTTEDLLKLPRWARVAFAARCARRVQSYFTIWSGATPELSNAVDKAISLAELSATLARTAPNEHTAVDVCTKAHAAGIAAQVDADSYEARDKAAAAKAAAAGLNSYTTVGDQRKTYAAREAAHAAAYAAMCAYDTAAVSASECADRSGWAPGYSARDYIDALRTDYARLTALAREQQWNENSPVDPHMLGPMWPGGKPYDDWPDPNNHLDQISGFTLTLDISDSTSDEEAERMVVDYIDHLDTLHRALGGHGLRVLPPMEVNEPARTAQGVGS